MLSGFELWSLSLFYEANATNQMFDDIQVFHLVIKKYLSQFRKYWLYHL